MNLEYLNRIKKEQTLCIVLVILCAFKKDDVLVSVDRQTSHLTESELFRFLLQNKMPGEKISVTVLRGSERMNLELPMQ